MAATTAPRAPRVGLDKTPVFVFELRLSARVARALSALAFLLLCAAIILILDYLALEASR